VKPFLIANAVTAGLLALFVGELVLRAGFENVLFGYTFSTSHSSLGDPFFKFKIGARLFLGFIPPLWFLLPFYGTWLFLWWTRGLSWLFFAVPVGLIMIFKTPPEPGTYHPSMLLIFAFSAFPILYSNLKKDFKNQWSEGVLFLAALAGSVLTGWSSALTVYVTFVTNNYSLAPIYALALPKKNAPWLGLLSLVIPFIIFQHKNLAGAFDDSTTGAKLVWMTHGPYAGLWTSETRQKFLLDLENDLEETTKGAASILFYDEFPLGYLMTNLKPATFSYYMHGLRESYNVRPYYQSYYSNPANRPDVIVRFNFFMVEGTKNSVHPDQYLPYQDVFWRYLPEESHEYTPIKEREAYSIFRRNSSVP
jgi:hypothetical protein